MRRFYKVATWRLISITATFILTWILTGDVKEASEFTILLHILLMSLHLMFEITWGRINSEER